MNKLDLYGQQVHAFTVQMGNLGFSQMTDLIMSMFNSDIWREFKDGLGVYKFLPGEFDYFLTQRGVKREDIIHGIRDVEVKAKLDKAMDEGRTGEADYRRRIEDARNENPQVPDRPMMPFGLTESEAKYVKIKTRAGGAVHRPALGRRARYGKQRTMPLLERLITAAAKLNDRDLDKLIESLKREQSARNNSKVIKLRVAK